MISDAAKSAGIANRLRFQGQYFDHETGLHYNRHRYYDPATGRFISKDPIGLKGGINPNEYAPNPVQWVDPLGLDKLQEAIAARDSLAAQLGKVVKGRPATVTAGYHIETGEVAARASGGGLCAEDHVVNALGGDRSKIMFTKAVRPRRTQPLRQVPVCKRCQGKYGRCQFPEPGTEFEE